MITFEIIDCYAAVTTNHIHTLVLIAPIRLEAWKFWEVA